ncbi:MAG: hypothetical protein ACXU82_13410 [Caulobacteraceae bacterium]
MQDLEVRSPTPSARSGPDLMAQVLANARSVQGGPAQPAKPALMARPAPPPPPKAEALPEIEARKPPGPQARPAAAAPPLKGPGPVKPPAYVAAASAAAAKAAAINAAAARVASAGAPTPAAPPAAPAPAAPAPPAQTTATSLIDETAPWLPEEPDRKTAFLQVFRYWHAQVRPEFAKKACPAFLFLVTALPVMVKARDTLVALDLWEPHGEHSRQKRDQHPSWKKYCEFLPRAQQALQDLDDYRHLSLLTALDDLNGRITKAEKKFREGLPQPTKGRR